MRLVIIIFIFFLNLHLFCQIKVDFSKFEDSNLFSSIYNTGFYSPEKYYEDSTLKQKFFYSDESYKKLDSLKRFYQDGSLAFFGVVLDKWIGVDESGREVHGDKTYEIAYYKSGKIRFILFKDETNEKEISKFLCLFDEKTNKIIYREDVFYGKKISGIFITYRDNDVNKFLLTFYKNGQVEEEWYISNIDDASKTFILEGIKLKDSEEITKNRKLRRYIRKKNIFRERPGFIIW